MEKDILFDYLVKLQMELAGIDTFCNDMIENEKKDAIYISLQNIQNIIYNIEQTFIYKKKENKIQKFKKITEIENYCEEKIKRGELDNYIIIENTNELTCFLNNFFENYIQDIDIFKKTFIETVILEIDNINKYVYIVSNDYTKFGKKIF